MAESTVNYASDSLIELMILSTLPQFGQDGSGILNSNMLTGYLNQKKAKEVIDGALEFWHGIYKAENTNAKWQGKNDDMTANSQDPKDRLRFAIKAFTDTIVVNDLEKAKNKGRAAIKSFVKDLREQAKMTIENAYNSGWWNTAPGSDEPTSIPSIVSITPTTGTVGGLNRAGNKYLQNGAHTDAIADIGSEAGIAKIIELRIKYAAGKSLADLLIMDEELFGGLAGYLVTQRRYKASEMMGQIGFESIELTPSCVVGFENTNVQGGANSITGGYVYGLNSKFLKIKTLKDGDEKWGTEFERIGKTLNRMLPYYWFGNLTTREPRAHWVANNVSTT